MTKLDVGAAGMRIDDTHAGAGGGGKSSIEPIYAVMPLTIEQILDNLTSAGHTKGCGEFLSALEAIQKLIEEKVIGANTEYECIRQDFGVMKITNDLKDKQRANLKKVMKGEE